MNKKGQILGFLDEEVIFNTGFVLLFLACLVGIWIVPEMWNIDYHYSIFELITLTLGDFIICYIIVAKMM